MAAPTGGRGGSVTKIVTTESGSAVFVHYPQLPAGPGDPPDPPAQEAHDDEFNPCLDPYLRRFENAKGTVDVDVNASGQPTKVTDTR